MMCDPGRAHPYAAHTPTLKVGASQQVIDQICKQIIASLARCTLPIHIHFSDNATANFGDGTVQVRAAHVDPQHHIPIRIEL